MLAVPLQAEWAKRNHLFDERLREAQNKCCKKLLLYRSKSFLLPKATIRTRSRRLSDATCFQVLFPRLAAL
jgi:hypothetical protein